MKIFNDYAKFYNLIYQDKPYKQEADFVYKWANKPKTIMELGCGTGQHAKYLCKKATIFAIDGSKEMLQQAYQNKNIYYQWLNIDEKLQYQPKVDCILAMFNVMGYVLLEDCISYLPLKDNGYFIFDIWDANKFKKHPPKVIIKQFKGGYKIAIPKQISKRIMEITYIIIYDNQYFIEKHIVEGYFLDDIKTICKSYGYKLVDKRPTNSWVIWYKLQKL